MWTIHSKQVARSRGFTSDLEQEALFDSTVVLAGLGGAGFPLGLNMVRDGVHHFIVADPDTISETNFNRHPGAFLSSLGENKAEVFRRIARDINPDVDIRVYRGGLTERNVEEMVVDADLVVDGIDFNEPWMSVLLHRTAREYGKPCLTGVEIGPSAIVTSFSPHTIPFEVLMGFRQEDSLDTIRQRSAHGPDIASSVAYLPFKSSKLNVLRAVQAGAPLPSNVRGVELFGAVTAHEAFLHLTSAITNTEETPAQLALRHLGFKAQRRMEPVWAPRFLVYDLDRRRSIIVRQSKIRFYWYVLLLAARSHMGLNPDVEYGGFIRDEGRRTNL